MKPEIVFKYKPLIDSLDIVRFFDILKNHRVYAPCVNELNDPFEGMICPTVGGVMGCSIMHNADKEHSVITSIKDNTYVISFSSDCFSPQMWAYYCHNYNGVVLGFYTDSNFNQIKKVKYYEKYIEKDIIEYPNINTIENLYRKSLLEKHQGWKYENEWRIIKDASSGHYINFSNEELAFIIIGHNLNKEIKDFIVTSIESPTKIFKTSPGELSGMVHLLKNDDNIMYDGSKPNYIDNLKDLLSSIK